MQFSWTCQYLKFIITQTQLWKLGAMARAGASGLESDRKWSLGLPYCTGHWDGSLPLPLGSQRSCVPAHPGTLCQERGRLGHQEEPAPSTHLLLRIFLGSRCFSELGVFGGAVQDPGRPLHEVAGEIYFHFGIFDSGNNCEYRKTTLLPKSAPRPHPTSPSPVSAFFTNCPSRFIFLTSWENQTPASTPALGWNRKAGASTHHHSSS